jgi:hypothetical protein
MIPTRVDRGKSRTQEEKTVVRGKKGRMTIRPYAIRSEKPRRNVRAERLEGLVAIVTTTIITPIVIIGTTALQIFEFSALTGDLPLLLFKLTGMGLLSLILSFHLIANRRTTQRTESTPNERSSSWTTDRASNKGTSPGTECTTSEC